jgi:hypothetical protein
LTRKVAKEFKVVDKEGMVVLEIIAIKKEASQMPVAHACNPSYSGGRDLEDRGSRPAWANSLGDPISKVPITKKD